MDLKSIHIPKILFLNGCFLSECDNIEDMFDNNLMSELDNKYENIVEYDKIPIFFKSMDTWLDKTNLKCWNCDCLFDSIPVFIPVYISKSESKDIIDGKITTHGNFCSFSCSASFLHASNLNNKWDIQFMLRKLYFIFYGKNIINIAHSPSKYIMKQYGGHVETLEYMNLIKGLNN